MNRADAASMAPYIEPVARQLLGEPNRNLSNGHDLRYGTHGSLSVDLEKGTWFDHEAGKGGGVIDLVRRELECDQHGAIEWLKENAGLPSPEPAKSKAEPADRSKGKGRLVARYVYTDAEGRPVHRTLRYEPKGFSQERYENGRWIGGKGALEGVQRQLYRLQDVLAADEVVICEGEKDCDRLHALGITATTSPEGVGKWQPGFADWLTGKVVTVLPDNDPVGLKHAETVAASLHGKAASVAVLDLKVPKKGGDVSDWLDQGHTAAALQELIAEAPAWQPPGDGKAQLAPGLQRISAVAPKSIDWNWYPYLPAGQIVILGGHGGVGKGLVAAALAARISKGVPWPTTDIQAPKGIVVWGETEDPLAQVIRPRLDAAEADVAEVHYCKPAEFAIQDIKALIKNHGLRLIVLSPMVSFLNGLSGINAELEVRSILEGLQADIEDTGCTILGICHTNKKPDLRAIERLLGTVAFTNFVRSVLLVAPDKDEAGWVRLAHAKHNLSVRGDDLLYRPVHIGENLQDQNVALEWKRPAGGNAETDAMFERKRQDANGHDREPTAGEWLVGYLRKHGKSLRADVVLAGQRAGYKEDTIAKAQARNNRINSAQEEWHGPFMWWLE